MLSINTVARVVVNTVRSAASPSVFDTGLLLVKDANYTDERRINRYDSGEAAAAGLLALGFADTSEPYRAAVKYFGAAPAPGRLLVSCFPSSETEAQALDAVLHLTSAFYGIFVPDTLSDIAALALAAHVEAMDKAAILFLPIMGTPAEAVASDGLLKALYDARYQRTVPFYCGALSDTAALLGTAMGLELSHPSSAFALCYKSLSGVTPSDLTQAQVDAIKALNGNVYVARGVTHLLLENGTVSSGLRYDEVLYMDRIADDLQQAAVALLAENPDRLPQTDDATALFINRFSAVLTGYTDRGILASAAWRGADTGPLKYGDIVENGFALWADSYDDQSDADRAAHKAVPVQCALALAGSLESIVITVNVRI